MAEPRRVTDEEFQQILKDIESGKIVRITDVTNPFNLEVLLDQELDGDKELLNG